MLDNVTDNNILVQLWLLKKSHRSHQWQRRWVVLRTQQLNYYHSDSEHKPALVISRANLLLYAVDRNHDNSFRIFTPKKQYHFRAENKPEFEAWCEHLDRLIFESDELNDENANASGEPEARPINIETEMLVEEGHVYKLRKRTSQWRKCYVVLTTQRFVICRNKDLKQIPQKLLDIMDLNDVVEIDGTKGRRWCLMIINRGKPVYVSMESESEMTKWLTALKAVIILRRKSDT